MSVILKYPKGLMAALGIRSGGKLPEFLADTVAPNVDLRDLYLLDTREFIQATDQPNPVLSANVFPAPNDLTVPPRELWYCWGFTVACSPGAGEAIDLCPSVRYDSTNVAIPVGPYKSATAGQHARAGALSPFWAGPGSVLGFVVASLTLQPDVSAAVVITRLRV